MARYPKEGLDYFPLDCDIESDEKIFFLESKHGTVAFSIIIKIWSRIFRKKGYYIIWDEREEITFSRQTTIPLNDVKMVVNDCINEGLFHQKLFQQYGVLTSKGVQKRYLGACYKRRRIQMIEALLLIPVTDYSNVIIVDLPEEITPLKPEEKPLKPEEIQQSKVKESKELKKYAESEKTDSAVGDGKKLTEEEIRRVEKLRKRPEESWNAFILAYIERFGFWPLWAQGRGSKQEFVSLDACLKKIKRSGGDKNIFLDCFKLFLEDDSKLLIENGYRPSLILKRFDYYYRRVKGGERAGKPGSKTDMRQCNNPKKPQCGALFDFKTDRNCPKCGWEPQ